MSDDVRNSNASAQRTRRNLLKMGPIVAASVAAAVVAKSSPALAGAGGSSCGIFGWLLGKCTIGGPNGPSGNCFLKGTKIQTKSGERNVETLAVGDLLPTMSGGMRAVQWIGRYPLRKSDPAKPWVKEALPVRIARSALGPGVPHADLYVTGSHAVFVDGVLVPAEVLINGTSITRFEPNETDELEFFHVKLETHDVIYAEGAAVETLRNVDESAVNFAEYFRLYGEPRAEDALYVPLVPVGGRAELKSRLRSALSPWLDRRELVDMVRDRVEERVSG
jgi:Hint domain